MILNQENNAILSEYSHEFEKDGVKYKAEIKCFENPVKKSEMSGPLYSALYIFKEGVLVNDIYSPEFTDEAGAKNVFANVEQQIHLLAPATTNEISGE